MLGVVYFPVKVAVVDSAVIIIVIRVSLVAAVVRVVRIPLFAIPLSGYCSNRIIIRFAIVLGIGVVILFVWGYERIIITAVFAVIVTLRVITDHGTVVWAIADSNSDADGRDEQKNLFISINQ